MENDSLSPTHNVPSNAPRSSNTSTPSVGELYTIQLVASSTLTATNTYTVMWNLRTGWPLETVVSLISETITQTSNQLGEPTLTLTTLGSTPARRILSLSNRRRIRPTPARAPYGQTPSHLQTPPRSSSTNVYTSTPEIPSLISRSSSISPGGTSPNQNSPMSILSQRLNGDYP